MANTKQQRKRVKIAERERSENLKYKSRIKTMFKTLTIAAQEDKERAAALGIELISLIDKAASRGVIHENNAARKKSRVTSIVELAEGTGKTKGPATRDAKGESKSDKRTGRAKAKSEKKAAVAVKKKAKAEAAAKAEKAKPKKEETAEAPAAEVAPVEEAPAAEAPAEEAPAEEAAAEEAPSKTEAEEAPVEEAAAEEAPAEAEETPAEEAEAEEKAE
ncbi:MAG: 30S ribosomal protein S20 [Thermoleophilia bacterium]